MAKDTGIAPSTLTGLIGKVIFYTAYGKSLVRSAPNKIRKNTGVIATRVRTKFSIASKFGKQLQPWLPYISDTNILGQNKYSSIVGQFVKMIANNLRFNPTINTLFSFGSNTIPQLTCYNVASYSPRQAYLKWTLPSLPAGWNLGTSYVDVMIFDINLTKFHYLPNRKSFASQNNLITIPNEFINGDLFFIYCIAYDEGINPIPYTRVSTYYPLQILTVIA